MTEARSASRPRFEFADGLRAVAALSIAVYHATVFTGRSGDVASDLPMFARLIELGNYAVPVFIVLSGFVLMLPILRTDDLSISGGFARYIGRRARRILPPYYASLLLFVLLIMVVPVLQSDSGTAWDNKVPITVGGLLSHLFVIHNFSGEWIYQINGPAWSIATEWQIYFLLPLVLLPLWRKFGPWWAVAVALVIGAALSRVPGFADAHYWFIGLFAFGMAAAHLAVSGARRGIGWLAIVGGLVATAWILVSPSTAISYRIVSETLVGAVVAAALVWLGSKSVRGESTRVHRLLETRFLVWVGLWSYSLYLIHSPLLALANLLLLPLGLSTATQLAVMIIIALPLATAAAYGFHRLVERRFITGHQKRGLRELSSRATP